MRCNNKLHLYILVETLIGKTMNKLIHKIKQFFDSKSAYQAELDRFISKYNPQSTAEVELLIRRFDRYYA